jgi:hypothetical protein
MSPTRSTADLIERQRAYLVAIFETDQAVEKDMRSIPFSPFQRVALDGVQRTDPDHQQASLTPVLGDHQF